jgi:fucose permease
MAARIIWSRVLLRAKGPPVVMGSALATAAGVVLLAAARSQIAGGLGMLVTGASIAGVYQTVLGQVGSCFEEQSGTVFGILFAVALTGGMAVPWVVGQLAEARGLRAGLLVTAVASLAVCGLQVAVLRRAATERGSR